MLKLIIYLKSNGDVIFRLVKSFPYAKKGQITSMGWKILDIQYYQNKRFYNEKNYYEYLNILFQKKRKKECRSKKIKKFFTILEHVFKD